MAIYDLVAPARGRRLRLAYLEASLAGRGGAERPAPTRPARDVIAAAPVTGALRASSTATGLGLAHARSPVASSCARASEAPLPKPHGLLPWSPACTLDGRTGVRIEDISFTSTRPPAGSTGSRASRARCRSSGERGGVPGARIDASGPPGPGSGNPPVCYASVAPSRSAAPAPALIPQPAPREPSMISTGELHKGRRPSSSTADLWQILDYHPQSRWAGRLRPGPDQAQEREEGRRSSRSPSRPAERCRGRSWTGARSSSMYLRWRRLPLHGDGDVRAVSTSTRTSSRVAVNYMKDGMTLDRISYDGRPRRGAPDHGRSRRRRDGPGFAGDTATGARKPANDGIGPGRPVPLFVTEGDHDPRRHAHRRVPDPPVAAGRASRPRRARSCPTASRPTGAPGVGRARPRDAAGRSIAPRPPGRCVRASDSRRHRGHPRGSATAVREDPRLCEPLGRGRGWPRDGQLGRPCLLHPSRRQEPAGLRLLREDRQASAFEPQSGMR